MDQSAIEDCLQRYRSTALVLPNNRNLSKALSELQKMNDKMIRIHHKYRQKRKKEVQKELRKKTSPSLLARPTFASSLMGGVFYEHVVILLMTTWGSYKRRNGKRRNEKQKRRNEEKSRDLPTAMPLPTVTSCLLFKEQLPNVMPLP